MCILVLPSKIWAKSAHYTWQTVVMFKALPNEFIRGIKRFYAKFLFLCDCLKFSIIVLLERVG